MTDDENAHAVEAALLKMGPATLNGALSTVVVCALATLLCFIFTPLNVIVCLSVAVVLATGCDCSGLRQLLLVQSVLLQDVFVYRPTGDIIWASLFSCLPTTSACIVL